MNSKSFYIIYNPISGSGAAKKILKKLKKDLNFFSISYIINKSEYKGHIKNLCQKVINYKKIIIIGGDGTFHEAINGLALNSKLNEMTIGFLPGGTGNSFMYDLKAPTYSQAFSKILKGESKKIDILKLKFKNSIAYSFNIVGWGLVSDINILAEKLRFLGSSRYTIASLYYIFFKQLREASLIIDGIKKKEKYLFIMCLNTIHTGKAMKAAPHALIDDGLLDIVLLDSKISIFKLIFLFSKIFKGTHIHSSYVEYIQAKSLSIQPVKNTMLNIDGENKLYTPVAISVLPKTINIFY